MLLGGFAIIGQVLRIQVIQGDVLLEKAQKQELKYFTIDATRGNILAEDGNLLATSVPIFEIRMDVGSPLISDKLFADNLDSLARQLANILKNKTKAQYKKDLRRARTKGNRYFLLKRRVNYSQLKKLKKCPILRKGKYKGGLIIIEGSRREMPYDELAKRTIGYEISKENLFVGLEGAYHEYLSGSEGKQLRRRLSHGDWKPVHDENQIEPKNGNDVISTIDVNIQDVAENALRKNLIRHEAFQGCAIVMEVETGEIKAIANLRRDEKDGKFKESYNYAIGEVVEPGSTVKLASLIALLEDNKIGLDDTIDIGDGWVVYHGHTMKDVKKIRDGRISVREAFEKSSNVGVSKLVKEAFGEDQEEFADYFRKFRLHEPLGLEIAGEGNPVVKHPSDGSSWYGTTLTSMSIGYEILLTPLQLLTLYNAVANNGKMVKPMFVKAITQSGVITEVFEPEIRVSSICSQETIDSVKAVLEAIVERGTARSINNKIYKIAGKTGTAQIADKNKGYAVKTYNSTFVGYFPADDPQYSCIAIINNPTKGYYYGSSVAAPVFKEISDKVYAFNYRLVKTNSDDEMVQNIPPFVIGNRADIEYVCSYLNIPVSPESSKSSWIVTDIKDTVVEYKTKTIKPKIVPSVIGMTAKDAVYILDDLGLKVRINGRGIVTQQSIKPGQPLIKGKTINLNLT